MSGLLGAETRRVDLIAEVLGGHSRDIQDLRTMAQRAVAEMRNAWAGPDFESIAQRWEQEAGPRLTDVSSALSTMAVALRAQAEAQRHTSGNTGGSIILVGTGGAPGGVARGGGGAVASGGGHRREVEDLDPEDLDVNGHRTESHTSTFINGHQVGVRKSLDIDVIGQGVPKTTLGDGVKDNVRLNFAQGGVAVDASLASMAGGGDNLQHEVSAGKVEAAADHSVDVDAHGNVVASAGVSAAAYAGYAAGRARGGNDLANGTTAGKAYVGAEVRADASGSVGPDGARGHVRAEAFAGAKVEVDAGGTLAGVTAAGGAEMSYGIGAHVDVDAALSATKVGVSMDLGATLGIGAGVTFDVSVSPQEVIANVGHVADDLGDTAEDVGRGLTAAIDQVASLLDW